MTGEAQTKVFVRISTYRLRKDTLQQFLRELFDDFDIEVSVGGAISRPKALIRKLMGA